MWVGFLKIPTFSKMAEVGDEIDRIKPRRSCLVRNLQQSKFGEVSDERIIHGCRSRICGYADMQICGYANMRVCGYADMRARQTGLTNRFQ